MAEFTRAAVEDIRTRLSQGVAVMSAVGANVGLPWLGYQLAQEAMALLDDLRPPAAPPRALGEPVPAWTEKDTANFHAVREAEKNGARPRDLNPLEAQEQASMDARKAELERHAQEQDAPPAPAPTLAELATQAAGTVAAGAALHAIDGVEEAIAKRLHRKAR